MKRWVGWVATISAAVVVTAAPPAAWASPEDGPVDVDLGRLVDPCAGWLRNPCAGTPPDGDIALGCVLGFYPFYPPAAELPCNPWIGEPPVRVEPRIPTPRQ